jgi:hypothetical protein
MVFVQTYTKKRTLNHMRAAFQDTPWLRRVGLRYMAAKLKEEDRQVIDERIGNGLSLEELCPLGDKNVKRVLHHTRGLVDEAPGVQGETLKIMARKVGVEGLQKLESMIGTLKKNPEKFIV